MRTNLLASILAVFLCTSVFAQEKNGDTMTITFDQLPDAAVVDSYLAYYGTESGVYDSSVSFAPNELTCADDRCSIYIQGLASCTNNFVALKAVNIAGESPTYSNEVVGWPNPELFSVLTTSPGVVQVNGDNFSSGTTLYVNGSDQPSDITVENCRTIALNTPTPLVSLVVRTPDGGENSFVILPPNVTNAAREE